MKTDRQNPLFESLFQYDLKYNL